MVQLERTPHATGVLLTPRAGPLHELVASAFVAVLPRREPDGTLVRVHALLAAFTVPDDEYADVAEM
jgi:hypothetical protein